ncbi:MAG: PIG-L family deacetylase [Anaerolineales bacterium]|nr:PIG-L family deacetylase [Anaerolineales bacterium]
MHLFLSPHPDDAALSCGGTIYDLVQGGESVVVWTLMAADVPMLLPESPLVGAIHQRWQAGTNPSHLRRDEDRAALHTLGVQDIRFGNWLDCIYRTDEAGHALYTNDDAIFGAIHPADPLHAAPFTLPSGVQVLYLPLGAGNHVDHRLVRDKALACLPVGATVYAYEEYPYSAPTNEVYHSHSGNQERLFGSRAVQTALEQIQPSTTLQTHQLSETALSAKIAAIACYHSQLSTFWHGLNEMEQRVHAYATEFGERLWLIERR